MAVNYYLSTDSGAPVMKGDTRGDLIALLDACLINGYGSKSAPGYWEKAFSATNKAAYRSTHPLSSGCYLRIDEANSGSTASARVRAYETMTDIDTGGNPFPTVAQSTDATTWWGKSSTANSTTRPWTVLADERFVWYLIGKSTLSSVVIYETNFFGDPIAFRTGVNLCVAGLPVGGAADTSITNSYSLAHGHHMRCNQPFEIQTGSVQGTSPLMPGSNSVAWGTVATYTIPGDMFLLYRNILLTGTDLRGYLPGLYHAPTQAFFSASNVVLPQIVGLEGRNIIAMQTWANSAGTLRGELYFDSTGPWR